MAAAKASKIAFSGVCAALSLVIMLLAGIVPTMSLAMPALAGCVLIAVTVETSEKYGFAVYAVVSVLSFFITAEKEAMLIFVLFFGYYPVLYSILLKIKNKFLSYLIKLSIFNVMAIVYFIIVTFVFMVPIGAIEQLGAWALPVLLILANLVFVLYDKGLLSVIDLYYTRLHPNVKKMMKK